MSTVAARVLVVEDDPDLAALEADVLAARGYRVEVACNGREALAAIEREAPDLILLDMKMPVMNGGDFAEEYRRTQGKAIVVVVTASEDAQRRAIEIGATDWIAKPFDPGDLVEKVKKVLTRLSAETGGN
jgi:DNA-binding response OmpR family regulator